MSKPITKVDCKDCKNVDCLIKKNTHIEGIEGLLEKKHQFKVLKGQNFIIEGAPVHGLYFIYEGIVKVFKTGLFGKEQIVRFINDGNIIGHRGFGAGDFHQIGAMALEDTILCSFSSTELHKALKTLPLLTFDFMQFYSSELDRSETKVRKFAQMTVREKVIDAFLYINRKFGQKKGLLNIQLSRKEIADFAGTTDEQVTRIITSLKKEKLIKLSGKKIGILDIEGLRKEISEHNFFLDL